MCSSTVPPQGWDTAPAMGCRSSWPTGVTRKLTFKGYVHDVTTIPSAMGNTLVGYITADTIKYLGGPDYYNELLVSVSENPTDAQHVTAVAHAITDRFKKDGTISPAQISMYNPGHHFAWQITQGVIFILSLLGWMTVLLSTFLIVNTIVALISQHIRQIGIMKAIGGGNGQILGMYLALLLAFSVIALGISIPLAGWAAALTGRFMASYLNYNQGPLILRHAHGDNAGHPGLPGSAGGRAGAAAERAARAGAGGLEQLRHRQRPGPENAGKHATWNFSRDRCWSPCATRCAKKPAWR